MEEIRIIPMRLIEACGGDRNLAGRVYGIVRPKLQELRYMESEEHRLRATLEATQTVMNRVICDLAKTIDPNTNVKKLLDAAYKDIESERRVIYDEKRRTS